MSRGGSASRPLAARSRAAAKGWASRRARAAAAALDDTAPARGSQADRVLRGADIGALIRRTIAALREREGA